MFRRHPSEETNFWPIVSDFMLGLFLLSILLAYKDRTHAESLGKDLEEARKELSAAREALHKQKNTYSVLKSITIEQSNKLGREGELPAPNLVEKEETDQKIISDALIGNVRLAIEKLQAGGVSMNDMRCFVIEQSNKLASYLPDGKTVQDDCGFKEAEEALEFNINKAATCITAVEGDVADLSAALHEIGVAVEAVDLKNPRCIVDAVKDMVKKVKAYDRAFANLSFIFGIPEPSVPTDDFVQRIGQRLDDYQKLEHMIRGLASVFKDLSPIAKTERVDDLVGKLKSLIQKLQEDHAQLEQSVRELVGKFDDTPSDIQKKDITVVLTLLKKRIQDLVDENTRLVGENASLQEQVKKAGDNNLMPFIEISSSDVSFEHGKSELNAQNEARVRQKFDMLRDLILKNEDKVTDIMFVGFTDKSGEEISNSNLGLQRATTIRKSWVKYVGRQRESERKILEKKISHNFSAGQSEAVVPAGVVKKDKSKGASDRHISIYLIGLKK